MIGRTLKRPSELCPPVLTSPKRAGLSTLRESRVNAAGFSALMNFLGIILFATHKTTWIIDLVRLSRYQVVYGISRVTLSPPSATLSTLNRCAAP